MIYLWIKTLHIIAMVAWFAELFYIFRLFVYHAKFQDFGNMCDVYILMEKKLIRIISYPAMVLTFISGVFMLMMNPGFLSQKWMLMKLLGVSLLLIYQFLAYYVHRQFINRRFIFTERACRMVNEVPTLLLILIIVCVIIRPFS